MSGESGESMVSGDVPTEASGDASPAAAAAGAGLGAAAAGAGLGALVPGRSAEFSKTVTEADVVLFAGLTGDFNPVHVSEPAAAASRFGGRIAHGMLSAAFISTVLGTRLPGPGTIYLGQTLRFAKPVRIGDTVTARVEVVEVIPDKRRVRLATTCDNQHGERVVEGEATVMVPGGGESQ